MKNMIGVVSVAVAVQLIGCDQPSKAITESQKLEKPASLPAKLTLEDEFALILKGAVANDGNAQLEVSKRYLSGIGVEKDEKKSLEWLEKSAANGIPKAQTELGKLYRSGERGAIKDARKAFELFDRAAAADDLEATAYLGILYLVGEGIEADGPKGIELLTKAANGGNARAQMWLGARYYAGKDGVKKDRTKALFLYEQAAAQSDTSVLVVLADWFFFLDTNAPKDIKKGYEIALKAANLGNIEAQSMLCTGDFIYKTMVFESEKQIEWCKKAAEASDIQALETLAHFYKDGHGVPKDSQKAFDLFHRAAKMGSAGAQLELGLMYATSNEIDRDFVLSFGWLSLAASSIKHVDEINNIPLRARRAMQQVEQKLSRSELAEARALATNWKIGTSLTQGGNNSNPQGVGGRLRKTGTGTAFFVSQSGHAITNHHVINGCKEVRFAERESPAKIVTSDAINDLSLLLVEGIKVSPATISDDPGKLRQGEEVVVFGFPLNSLLSSGGNLTLGVVSATTGLGNNTNQIQITAPIQPGSSGSAVMTKRGEVVAVVSMKLSDSKMAKATGSVGQNVNFAVSGQTLKSFLKANGIEYKSGGFLTFEKNTADIAEEAKKWTTVVECWK